MSQSPHSVSSRGKRGCGFTFEVQQFEEDLGGRPEAEALSRRVVIGCDEGIEKLVVDGVEVGSARQGSAQSTDGVFDGALLPGAMGVAEEGPDAELVGEDVMLSELGAVVEGDGLAQPPIESLEPGNELISGGMGSFARLLGKQQEAGLAFVRHQDDLAGCSEEHEVGFPMAVGPALLDGIGAQGNGDAVFDEAGGGAAPLGAPTALVLGSRQVVAPSPVVGAADLGVDEAVDGLVADGGRNLLALEPT